MRVAISRTLPTCGSDPRRDESRRRLLHVAIHSALAHLIVLDLDEGVVPAFGANGEARDAERARKGARSRCCRRLSQADAREEGVGGGKHLRRWPVTTIEVPHQVIVRPKQRSWRRRWTLVEHLLHPLLLLERVQRIATEAKANGP